MFKNIDDELKLDEYETESRELRHKHQEEEINIDERIDELNDILFTNYNKMTLEVNKIKYDNKELFIKSDTIDKFKYKYYKYKDIVEDELKTLGVILTDDDNIILTELNKKIDVMRHKLNEHDKQYSYEQKQLENKKQLLFDEFHKNRMELEFKYRHYLYKKEYKYRIEYYNNLLN